MSKEILTILLSFKLREIHEELDIYCKKSVKVTVYGDLYVLSKMGTGAKNNV